jgi:chorismate synthase
VAFLSQVGDIQLEEKKLSCATLKKQMEESQIFCPERKAEKRMKKLLETIEKEKESIGSIVSFRVENLPKGLGDPVYEKLQANLAKAMMSLPGSRGFSIGEGFSSSCMKGSEHNDRIGYEKGEFFLKSSHSGGVLGGISTSEPLIGKVAFKPTSSIGKKQWSVDQNGFAKEIASDLRRNDLCIAIRACPAIEAMIAIVLVDALFMAHITSKEMRGGPRWKKRSK